MNRSRTDLVSGAGVVAGRAISIVWLCIVLALGSGGTVQAQSPAQGGSSIVQLTGPCGTKPLTLAAMPWPSSAVLAHIHALILARELGCDAEVISGDMASSISSMSTTGQPAIAPEIWVTRVAAVWNSTLEAGRVRAVAPTFSGGEFEGWYLPAHVAASEPELNRADQLAAYGTRLNAAGTKPQFISCPADWACSVINANLLRAYGLSDLFEIVEPGNRFEMDTLIARAVSRAQPVVFYYWQPNSVLAQFEFRALDMGPYDADRFSCLASRDCSLPEVSSFVPETVFIAVSDWVTQEAPAVVRYLQRASMPLDEMNRLLAEQAEGGKSLEEVAAQFVRNRRDVWGKWLEGI
ncbi:MAG TPA: hypothetical protein ENJ90_09480 [Devosia sp.]|nr:hypothetical protein [Devosia sp.]